jgi:hypothetical protein
MDFLAEKYVSALSMTPNLAPSCAASCFVSQSPLRLRLNLERVGLAATLAIESPEPTEMAPDRRAPRYVDKC